MPVSNHHLAYIQLRTYSCIHTVAFGTQMECIINTHWYLHEDLQLC